MIYIYNDFGGSHSTIMAASYHLGRLDPNREPTSQELLAAPHFNKLEYGDRGKLYFHGVDEEGNQVYTMARGRSKVLIPGICQVLELLHEQKLLKEKIILSNTSPTVPFALTCGGLLSRMLRIHFLGVPLILIGCKSAYRDIVHLVNHTKEVARSSDAHLVRLENKKLT